MSSSRTARPCSAAAPRRCAARPGATRGSAPSGERRPAAGPWSGREDDGSGGVAAGHLGEGPGGIGETVGGGDRDLQLPVAELLG